MRYLPHTNEDIAAMLEVVGVSGLDELFSVVPDNCRRKKALSLPEPLSEWELNEFMSAFSHWFPFLTAPRISPAVALLRHWLSDVPVALATSLGVIQELT